MATSKVVLIGINSLSYGEFMICKPKTLLYLLGNSFRGVVENNPPKDAISSWLSIFSLNRTNNNESINKLDDLPLIKLVNPILINIPISNPTYGRVNIKLDQSISYQEEIDTVMNEIMENQENGPIISGITALERIDDKSCEIYNAIDKMLLNVIRNVDEFIIFSPYGMKKGKINEPYGVYLSSRPRPNEHDTVKLWEIGQIFVDIVKGDNVQDDF
ncbi:hypothetical protein Calag_0623 [Caldisphaera lagunensis DSM 15908]|uniref:Uncharacterized protein n=1 Tax=Caldisphaera lagunensis (strain DSM 15908 / JCM 11604 / ANMR 0165 / IC-154) TaxID=1056495 RepID=L0A911_CALLD|nr:hypothetical protein [Caldisphaera lagunensis]AFZ70378.1 hypothetical protein Calag_0623 [Caldisphaera lagunensis DSM 15908]